MKKKEILENLSKKIDDLQKKIEELEQKIDSLSKSGETKQTTTYVYPEYKTSYPQKVWYIHSRWGYQVTPYYETTTYPPIHCAQTYPSTHHY